MIEIISIKIKYFISTSLAIALTTLSLYYAFQWNRNIDLENDMQERILNIKSRLLSKANQIRCVGKHLSDINEQLCYIKGRYNHNVYNQTQPLCNQETCVQEAEEEEEEENQAHDSCEYNSHEDCDTPNQNGAQDYDRDCGNCNQSPSFDQDLEDQKQEDNCLQT